METLTVTLVTGILATLRAGAGVVVGWSAEKGDRGAGAVHYTERVHAVHADAGVVILTGGNYKANGRHTVTLPDGTLGRILPVFRADGTVTTQLRAVEAI